jgi:carnitine O-palmitoyltransferase 1
MSRKWKLSTSQVLPRQLPDRPPEKNDEFRSTNGGFGPVADDGYGVCYSLYGEKLFYFNVSSKKSCPETDSARFLNHILTALEDLGNLVKMD